jgi:uncharacterized protein (UPF0261 family)
MEQFKNNEGVRTLSEWLFDETTPRAKYAAEHIFNDNSSITKVQLESVNDEEAKRIKGLIGEWLEITDAGHSTLTPEQKIEKKKIEKEFAQILDVAFDREFDKKN